jgi:hypothetical protein
VWLLYILIGQDTTRNVQQPHYHTCPLAGKRRK